MYQSALGECNFPQWNGLERSIQTVKRSKKKAHETKNDPFLSLLVSNTTPSNDGNSPAYKMYHWDPCTTLLSANIQTSHAVAQNSKVKETYDQHARDLTNIQPGTTVRIRTDKEKCCSQKGNVVKKCKQPRAYQVMNEKGNIVRRNRRHLLPTMESFKVTSDYDDLQMLFKPKLPLNMQTSTCISNDHAL